VSAAQNVGRGHGETAVREATAVPWQEFAVDLIGPWTLPVNGTDINFMALSIIDTGTNLVEVVRLNNKTSAHVALQFENPLSRVSTIESRHYRDRRV
jgi:hypothetical protein